MLDYSTKDCEKYHIQKGMVSGREVYIILPQYLKQEWEAIVEDLGWNKELIRCSYVDIINQFEKLPVALGIVYIETYRKPYNYMPALCFYQEGEYHLVQYSKQWFCQNCMYKTPRQFAGYSNVLIPLCEHESSYYPDRKFPSIPAFFQKKKCPKCGTIIHQHLFCLEEVM